MKQRIDKHTTVIKNTQGFTLVELAIALMVIGLLIGGVLKGQELIENARVTRTVKDINDYDTAIMIFRNTYNGLPGDLRQPNRLPNCDNTPTDAACNYVNANTGSGTVSGNIEPTNFWRHLERAGLITGINENGTHYNISPINSFGGHYIFRILSPADPTPTAQYPEKHYYRIGSGASDGTPSANADYINVGRMIALDNKMDDGRPLNGRVQTYHNLTTQKCFDEDSQEYLSTLSTRCYLVIESSTAN